ncbi:MAG: lysophospholipid acyltransferase family protein [Gemmatimonadaceae bacterium]|nr:lysophospholipid acyltransferase family protein [Gemmatimonadaceae bacterium]
MTRWQMTLAAHAGTWLIRLLSWTWRRDTGQRAAFEAARRRADGSRGGVVLAFWHGEILPVLVEHAGDPAHAMISQSADGELIARISGAFGARAIRGSSSKGGAEALVRAVQLARDGQVVVITPDGPRGPRHAVAPGVVKAAQKAGVALIGVRTHADRAWVFRSWDRFTVPKPFARVTYAYTPVLPLEGVSLDDGAARLAAAMRETGRSIGSDD